MPRGVCRDPRLVSLWSHDARAFLRAIAIHVSRVLSGSEWVNQ